MSERRPFNGFIPFAPQYRGLRSTVARFTAAFALRELAMAAATARLTGSGYPPHPIQVFFRRQTSCLSGLADRRWIFCKQANATRGGWFSQNVVDTSQ